MSSTQASPFILKLDSPEATLELVGGKGASLARMAAAGLPVPPGFQITTHAYRRFVSENRLADAILSAAAEASAADPATLERASPQIQSLLAQSTIPEDVAALMSSRTANWAQTIRPSRCARQPPRKICRRCPSPAKWKLISTSAAVTMCWLPSSVAGVRCGRRAPSATARNMASVPKTSASPSWCSNWFPPT